MRCESVFSFDANFTMETPEHELTINNRRCWNTIVSDVPVWLEVMNRTKRTKQLVYAVRVKETVTTTTCENNNDKPLAIITDSEIESAGVSHAEMNKRGSGTTTTTSTRMFVKLRTGSQLAPVLRLGIEHKTDLSPPSEDQWQQRWEALLISNLDE